ncbi:MAG: beta-propeller domain-containing protein, partial [Oscillospiraceae bacterium]|nr:beta-propeller domain-containing protein [Oscillospiraceae bacterium]
MVETLSAKQFLSEIKKLNLSGKDFLEIIGNSKISNDIYNEIKESTGLTYERLVGLLEDSALISEDFTRLLRDAHTLAHLRVLERRQRSEQRLGQALGQAEERLEHQLKASVKAQKFLTEAKKKAEAEMRQKSPAAAIETPEPEPVQEITQNIGFEPEVNISEDEGFYEDIIDDEPDENEESAHVTAAYNKGKIIFCCILAIMLIGASFGLRWFYTGSFLPEREQPTVFAVPETYHELAERLMNTDDLPSVRSERTEYRVANDEVLAPATLLLNNKYIFNVIGNALYIVEYNNGNVQKTAEIEYGSEQIRELFLINEKLFVITESEYEGSFEH